MNDRSPPPDELPRGATPDAPARVGRYEVLSVLGTGGMARVYLARLRGDAGFTQLVAIKRALPHVAVEPASTSMLLDEARVAASIRHANVIPTLDVIDDPSGAAVVMQFVEGVSLLALFNHLARAGTPIPVGVAVSIVCGALSGLHAAHEAKGSDGVPLGVVHRDVSANNVMVGVDGVVRVFDFGVAKMRSRAQPTTEEGNVKGTLAYMAPEQVERRPVDRRVDVYAASVLLWQCLAGRRLWQTSDSREIITATLFDEPPDLHELRDEVSPELAAVVRRGLAKSPDDRWPTARAMADALEAVVPLVSSARMAEWLARVAPDLVAGAAPPASTLAADAPRPVVRAAEETTRPASPVTLPSRRTPWIVGAALIAVVGAVAALRRGPIEPAAPAPPASSGAAASARSSAVSASEAAAVISSAPTAQGKEPELADAAPRPQSSAHVTRPRANEPPPTASSSAAPTTSSDVPIHRRPGAIPDSRR